MWENNEIDLGLIHTGKSHVINFKFTGNSTPQNVKITTSCGCNSGRWIESEQILEVIYSISKIPSQVIGNQHIRKSIKINYFCDNIEYNDNVFFKAELINE